MAGERTRDTDVAIVGGGIVGASAALHLARHGRRVTVLERGEIASGASGVNHGHAAEILPFLGDQPAARTWAGLMPFSLDGKPLIGRVPARRGLWIVSGLASSGFGRGPMAGKLLADALHTGTPAPVLAEADPARGIREAMASRGAASSPAR